MEFKIFSFYIQDEGIAREIINRIQKLRKKAHLVPTDKVTVYLTADSSLKRITEEFSEYIQTAVKAKVLPFSDAPSDMSFLIQEDFEVK